MGRTNRILAVILLLALPCSAQHHRKIFTAAVNPTPGFVSSNVSDSTLELQVTTLASGTVTCAVDYAFCAHYPDPAPAGSTGAIYVTYGATSAEVPSVTDNESDSYTHASCESNDSTNHRWGELFFNTNLTAGARDISVRFPTTVTYAQVHAVLLYNVGSFDACSQAASTSSVTSFTAGNLTTTTGNDMALVFTVQTNPTNTSTSLNNLGPFAADSGWNQISNAHRNGEAAAYEVVPSAGTITPKITSSASAAYIANAIAFKSATQGNAPTGMYIACMGSFNSAFDAHTVTTFTEGMPCGTTGNLIDIAAQGGSQAVISAISLADGTNTWARCGGFSSAGGNQVWGGNYYASNATISNSLSPTATVNWNGSTSADLSLWWYVIAGSNTTGGCAAYPWTALSSSATATNSFTMTTTARAAASSSLNIAQFGTAFNTPIAQTSPGPLIDVSYNAGESRDGPWTLDQNNARGHFAESNASPLLTWIWGMTSSATGPGEWNGNVASFPYPGAVWLKDAAVTAEATGTAQDVQASVTTTASSTLMVGVILYSSTVRTISSVKLDGNTSCSTGTTINPISGTTTTGVSGSQGATAIFYLTGVSAGAHTVTACANSPMVGGHFDIAVQPVINVSTTDGTATANQNSSVSGGAATGSGVTTTATKGYCMGIFSVSNAVTASPASGNDYTFGSSIFTSQDAWTGLLSTSAASHAPAVSDSSGTFNGSNACLQ